MYKIIIYIISASYIAISKFERVDFSRWCIIKRRFNYFLNKKIILWVASSSNSKKYSFCDQFLIDSIIEVVFIHYRQRVVIYGLLKKLPYYFRRVLFIQISVVCLLLGLLGKLFREIISTLYVYKREVSVDKTLNLCLNFPKHSFSVTHKADLGSYYSFGEYLTLNYPNTKMFSFGEYVRASKKNVDSVVDNDTLEFQRHNPVRRKKIIIFVNRILKAIIYLLFKDRTVNKGFFLKLIYARKYLYQSNFTNMLVDTGLGYKNIENIFTLPFADMGLLKYSKKFYKKVLVCSYSQNALIMPSPNMQEIIDQIKLFEYMPLSALTLTEKSFGFTSLYSNAKKIKEKLNNEFSLDLSFTFQSEREAPMILGYEKVKFSQSIEKKLIKQKNVAIFDAPPCSDYKAMSMSTNGDKIHSYEFIGNFIIDAVETSISNGFGIIIKPKYSLSKYSDSYGNLLKDLMKKYKNKIIIADPYLRMGSIVKHCCGSINIPYTSTKLIFESNNVPSVYYVPEKYKLDFTKNFATSIEYGRKELGQFLNNIN